jgi:hypothetical protein
MRIHNTKGDKQNQKNETMTLQSEANHNWERQRLRRHNLISQCRHSLTFGVNGLTRSYMCEG